MSQTILISHSCGNFRITWRRLYDIFFLWIKYHIYVVFVIRYQIIITCLWDYNVILDKLSHVHIEDWFKRQVALHICEIIM